MIEKVATQTAWLTSGWQIYKHQHRSLIIASLIFSTPSVISFANQGLPVSIDLILSLFQQVGVTVLAAGWGLFCINLVRGHQPKIATIFSGVQKIKTVIVVNILYGLIVFAGLFLLVAPGVIWALKYSFSTYLVMDKNLSAREALRTSGQSTKGHKGKLFTISIMFFLLWLPSFTFYYGLQRIIEGNTMSGWSFFAVGLVGWIASILIITPWFGTTWASAYEELSRKLEDARIVA